jgi:hypothetical protein
MAHQPSGWYTDPTNKYSYRFWNGTQWTNQVSTGGNTGADPDPMGAEAAAAPPAPGTEAPTQPQSHPATTVQVTQKRGSAFGTIIGVILAIIAIVVLVAILMNVSSDDSTDTTVAPPASTEAPTTTAAG